jgi:small subunit ribosomal protein S6
MEVRRYESIIVFNPRLNDSQLKDEIKRVEGILANNKAKVTGVDSWGKKEIAYLVKKERFGYYVVFNYESENHAAPNELGSLLRITENVHKFQTHVISETTRKFKGNPKRVITPGMDDDYEFGNDAFD